MKCHTNQSKYGSVVEEVELLLTRSKPWHPKTELCQSRSHDAEQFMPAEQFWAETSAARLKQTIIRVNYLLL